MNRLVAPFFMCLLLTAILLAWGLGSGALAQTVNGDGTTQQTQAQADKLTPSQKRADELAKRYERMFLKDQWAQIRRELMLLGPRAEGAAPKLAQ
jgi:hypothetical protein